MFHIQETWDKKNPHMSQSRWKIKAPRKEVWTSERQGSKGGPGY